MKFMVVRLRKIRFNCRTMLDRYPQIANDRADLLDRKQSSQALFRKKRVTPRGSTSLPSQGIGKTPRNLNADNRSARDWLRPVPKRMIPVSVSR